MVVRAARRACLHDDVALLRPTSSTISAPTSPYEAVESPTPVRSRTVIGALASPTRSDARSDCGPASARQPRSDVLSSMPVLSRTSSTAPCRRRLRWEVVLDSSGRGGLAERWQRTLCLWASAPSAPSAGTSCRLSGVLTTKSSISVPPLPTAFASGGFPPAGPPAPGAQVNGIGEVCGRRRDRLYEPRTAGCTWRGRARPPEGCSIALCRRMRARPVARTSSSRLAGASTTESTWSPALAAASGSFSPASRTRPSATEWAPPPPRGTAGPGRRNPVRHPTAASAQGARLCLVGHQRTERARRGPDLDLGRLGAGSGRIPRGCRSLTPDFHFQPGCCSTDPNGAREAGTGRVVYAWNRQSSIGTRAMVQVPGEAPREVPNSLPTQLGHRLGISGRIGARGIYVAYLAGNNNFEGVPALWGSVTESPCSSPTGAARVTPAWRPTPVHTCGDVGRGGRILPAHQSRGTAWAVS